MIDVLTDQLTTAGGPILAALLVISVIATTVTIFKVVQFARIGVGRTRGARSAVAAWAAGDRAQALDEARSENSPAAAAVAAAMASFLDAPADRERARELSTQTALDQLATMSRHLRVLEAVAQAAPMIGLLGTVVGMISAFGELSASGGAVDPSALATGIWTALLTTAAGLTVAIPFYFVSVWLEARVDAERATMEAAIGAVLYSGAGGIAGQPAPEGPAAPVGMPPQPSFG
ncbi:MotA/TolQ/ExbB proton channel family protein [Chelativorans salis]|uniref:MotA/TolQ/ExbB proton channel family protein n=1 Tax=Chelativorans salis TaxID=2978478 RepID=A0ABT2LJW5_9HYPH|nr:MotA/TolQ/ExbB proton channel family protein [Chelativorans sp. EGI FJ00035]MCT7374127.1 MotA/TolQ/ExbB proton channel family protein [Chelativorans sp. EGI FJ00035]